MIRPLSLATCLSLISGAGAAQDYTFRLHHFLAASSPSQTEVIEPWVEAVEAASDGRVEIEIYPSMTLGGRPQELVSQVRDGVVDLIWVVNGYTPGLFPRTEVFELPTVYENDPGATNLAMHEMFEEDLAQDYKGLEVMFLHVHAGQGLQMAEREVHRPEDLAGTSLRIPTRTGAWVIEALGANPVAMPVPELPQALSKGVVDGAMIPWQVIPPLGLQAQTAYHIEGADNLRFGTTVFQLSMNADRWNALPGDIQEAFRAASGPEWLRELGRTWRRMEEEGLALATAAGSEHIELTQEETEAFMTRLEPVVDRWIAEAEAEGIDGKGLVAEARERIAANLTTSAQ